MGVAVVEAVIFVVAVVVFAVSSDECDIFCLLCLLWLNSLSLTFFHNKQKSKNKTKQNNTFQKQNSAQKKRRKGKKFLLATILKKVNIKEHTHSQDTRCHSVHTSHISCSSEYKVNSLQCKHPTKAIVEL